MGRFGYPPSHRGTEEPQPEVCDLCGLEVGGARLRHPDIDGLRGFLICDEHDWRDIPEIQTRDQALPAKIVGQGRIYEPGAHPWFLASRRLLVSSSGGHLAIGSGFHLLIQPKQS